MKLALFLFIHILVYASGPFDTPKTKSFDLSMFDTKMSTENIKASKNKKFTCKYVCDEKVYKEQKIANAISFYKKKTK